MVPGIEQAYKKCYYYSHQCNKTLNNVQNIDIEVASSSSSINASAALPTKKIISVILQQKNRVHSEKIIFSLSLNNIENPIITHRVSKLLQVHPQTVSFILSFVRSLQTSAWHTKSWIETSRAVAFPTVRRTSVGGEIRRHLRH